MCWYFVGNKRSIQANGQLMLKLCMVMLNYILNHPGYYITGHSHWGGGIHSFWDGFCCLLSLKLSIFQGLSRYLHKSIVFCFSVQRTKILLIKRYIKVFCATFGIFWSKILKTLTSHFEFSYTIINCFITVLNLFKAMLGFTNKDQ